ncbi:MAG TPA: glycosyltransferase [Candidatus Eisenbacteria bacterium]|jgi:glycosyltransferase involved in cell wall biosynthesis
MRLSLVVPAHNESTRIERSLRTYREALGPEVELIVVANRCSDDTAAITRRVAEDGGGITLIDVPDPIGKGGAVRVGFARAGGEFVGFVDADLATPPEDIERVLAAAARSGAAIGSRWLPESRVIGRTAGREVAGRLFAALVRGLLGLKFRDIQCGIKIFHRRFLPGYLAASRVSDLAFDAELLLLLQEAGATIEEVPTTWTAQPGSSSLGTLPGFVKQGARMAKTILLLWWRHRSTARGNATAR